MSQQYFQFKQFRVEQGQCAMKVTTDACIQGAWTPIEPGAKHVLDIGTGTGLLSLMLAQREQQITIDAVEYDAAACEQATQNFSASPWGDRLNTIEGDVKAVQFTYKYDLIITNPPFFVNSLQNDEARKSMARHAAGLSFADLAAVIVANLNTDGKASVLLPVNEYAQFRQCAASIGLYDYSTLQVRHTDGAAVKRVVGMFSFSTVNERMDEELIIKQSDGAYTAHFISLLSPFYLYL